MAQAWEFGGVDLTRLGYNVTVQNTPVNLQNRRGNNIVIPGKTGRQYVDKVLDQKPVVLSMFVRDIPPGGGAASEAQLLTNLDTLRALFGADGQQNLVHTIGGSSREAMAEVVNAFDFQPAGQRLYRFVVELTLSGGLWRAQSTTTVGPTTITTNPQNMTVDASAGTYPVRDAVITVTGVITDPTFTIGTDFVKYTGTVDSGETLVIDMGEYTAELDAADVAGDISHDGDLCWLPLPAASNTLVVSATSLGSPSPTVQVDFKEAYL